MARYSMLLFLLCTVFTVGYCKHVHPSSILRNTVEAAVDPQPIDTDIDGIPIEMINRIQPSRFVPINNVLFFQRYPPCEEGFERDLLGVCREVWE